MHILRAEAAGGVDAIEPVDPGQTPADIVVLSAADTDLAALAAALDAWAEEAAGNAGEPPPTVRLAKLDWFRHPYSVDRYLDETAGRSQLVIARVLGGEGYWPYGIEQFEARLKAAGTPFAALPGDDKPDAALRRASSVSDAAYERLWGYLVEGGPENARAFLEMAAHLLGRGAEPPPPRPLLRAGVYAPGGSEANPADSLAGLRERWRPGAPTIPIIFYRAWLAGGGLAPVDALAAALSEAGANPLPIFVASLKDPVSAETLAQLFAEAPPAAILNLTGFAVSAAAGDDPGEAKGAATQGGSPLDAPGRPIIQLAPSSGSEADWRDGLHGLSARDIAMYAALPEVDGRIIGPVVSFKAQAARHEPTQCPIAAPKPNAERCAAAARLAISWARLASAAPPERRVALVLANYPIKDGRLANGVGLDAPESAARMLTALRRAGYDVAGAPETGADLMTRLKAGPTNALSGRAARIGGERLSFEAYRAAFADLPSALQEAVTARWGPPEDDPYADAEGFRIAMHVFGGVAIGLQPPRGYHIDAEETYHAPDLVPPHAYLAFYAWIRRRFGAHAAVQIGKHGTLEWLPGKSLGLSEACWPEALLGPTPLLYPFIVNDPGEGTQAKRRSAAVILGHMTPPMTRAESYGAQAELEGLLDEYAEASALDPRRRDYLGKEILTLMAASGLDQDLGVDARAAAASADPSRLPLEALDAHLCELKEAQIRDGLHIFGAAPEGRLETDLLAALARAPRGDPRRDGPSAESLLRALAADLTLSADADGDQAFDPLDCALGAPWLGPKPPELERLSSAPWRIVGDAVERLELLSAALISGEQAAPAAWTRTRAVLQAVDASLRPALQACGPAETSGLLSALEGRFVAPGPSGAPTRGRPDVLPTGRNFYSLDSRAVPTAAAWRLGWASADRLMARHIEEEGDWPKAMALTAWGTANMRTGGDDIAQALALIGARPVWDGASRRVTGFEIIPLSALGRPRVDVTLRISGFFRDAFPAQTALFDRAARAVLALDEPETENPGAARWRRERDAHIASGLDPAAAQSAAGRRVFGSKPGAYGAGLQALIDERVWSERSDFGRAFLEWGGYAYGAEEAGAPARASLETRLAAVDAIVQNQDNREHDILDSDDYYQFEGGLASAAAHLSGREPVIWHNDHSRPERPVIRRLDEEIARVVRSRAANPKWLRGVMRHGYKGAFEIAATVDYLFAFAATTRAVRGHHFDLLYDAVLDDGAVEQFLEEANPDALREIEARLAEAIDRGLWRPRSNRAAERLGRGERGGRPE